MKEIKSVFKGVWIPAEVWESDLSPTAKLLWATVSSLGRKGDPCYASNAWLAERMDSTVESIKVQLSKLRKAGWIEDVKSEEEGERWILAVVPEGLTPINGGVNSRLRGGLTAVNQDAGFPIDARARSEENKVENKVENCADAPSPKIQKPEAKPKEASPSPAAASAAKEAYALWQGHYNDAHPGEPYFNGMAKRRKADESAMRALVASGRTPAQIGETARRMFAAARQAVNGKRAWWSEHCKTAANFCEHWPEITGELGPVAGSTSGTQTTQARSDVFKVGRKEWTREQGPVREEFRDDSSYRAHNQAWQQWAEGKA